MIKPSLSGQFLNEYNLTLWSPCVCRCLFHTLPTCFRPYIFCRSCSMCVYQFL